MTSGRTGRSKTREEISGHRTSTGTTAEFRSQDFSGDERTGRSTSRAEGQRQGGRRRGDGGVGGVALLDRILDRMTGYDWPTRRGHWMDWPKRPLWMTGPDRIGSGAGEGRGRSV